LDDLFDSALNTPFLNASVRLLGKQQLLCGFGDGIALMSILGSNARWYHPSRLSFNKIFQLGRAAQPENALLSEHPEADTIHA
jgi:hypothetical protein